MGAAREEAKAMKKSTEQSGGTSDLKNIFGKKRAKRGVLSQILSGKAPKLSFKDIKDVFKAGAKLWLTITIVIIVIIMVALIELGLIKEESSIATTKISKVMEKSENADAVEMYENSGSLILADDEILSQVATDYFEDIISTDKEQHDALNKKYSGVESSTVANRVINIATGTNEKTTLEKVDTSVSVVSGQASLSEERTIFEHILRAEKYNFNNIVWRSFEKNGDQLKETDIEFQVDAKSKLKYPKADSLDKDDASHDIKFYVSKVKSYLQSYYIPLDLLLGTRDGTASQNGSINTDFAYRILANAYHDIVLDRYKIENLTRTNNYVIYDKTTTTETVTRSCGTYDITDENGETTSKTLCTDATDKTTSEEKGIRETVNSKDVKTYRWNYVVSAAKTFDTVINSKYGIQGYYNYSTDVYENYISKADGYSDMTVEEYAEAEQSNAHADSFSHTDKEYHDTKIENVPHVASWNAAYVVTSIPEGAVLTDEIVSDTVSEKITTVKDGLEYEDIYVWNDNLTFEETTSGVYNVDSVEDITGDLYGSDEEYYRGLYLGGDLNIIDLMNADKEIYSQYLTSPESDTIGCRHSILEVGYMVLSDDLATLMASHPTSGLAYGSSIGLDINSLAVLDGIRFGSMENIASGRLDGQNVAYPIANEELKNAYLQVGSKYGSSYGYAGHTGVDISYAYSKADKSLCSDFSNSTCPYIKGPGVYSTMDGTIEQVGYSAYNKYYNVGTYVGRTSEGNLIISDTSGWGTYVKMKNLDGSYTIYSHLYPDKTFYTEMSNSIGQVIAAGTFIGYMGNTGNSSGLHLHIEFTSDYNSLGGATGNSSLTYIYLMKIVDAMGISPTIS